VPRCHVMLSQISAVGSRESVFVAAPGSAPRLDDARPAPSFPI